MSSTSRITRSYNASIHLIRFFFALVTLYCFFNSAGCSHSVDSPLGPQPKDPRTYSWTIDTLSYVRTPGDLMQTVIGNIWGANDTLVYGVGWDASGGQATMWQYDGKKWERTKLSAFGGDGGPVAKWFVLWDVKGFGANDIYACGESSTNITGTDVSTSIALHYDGVQWRELDLPKGNSWSSLALLPPSRVYVGGDHGRILTFDGARGTVDTLTFSPYKTPPADVQLIAPSSDNGMYLCQYQWSESGRPISTYFLKYQGKQAALIDSSKIPPSWGGFNYWQSNKGSLFSCGPGGIFRFSDLQWKNVYATDVIFSIYGVSEEHVFATGLGGIYFYDGKNWDLIHAAASTYFYASRIWCSENEVFIAYSDNRRSYILHGK